MNQICKLGTFVSAAAIAVTALLTPSAQALVRSGIFYEDYVSVSCGTSNVCNIPFTQTPSDKFLTVNLLTCRHASTRPLLEAALSLSGAIRFRYIPIPNYTIGTGGSLRFYTFYVPDLDFKIGRGKVLLLNTYSDGSQTGNVQVECTITGVLSDN